MTAKDLLLRLKRDLERDSSSEIMDVAVEIDSCGCLPKATVVKFVEGAWQVFEVSVKPMGISQIEIKAT